jgi:hypothetical protein
MQSRSNQRFQLVIAPFAAAETVFQMWERLPAAIP